LGISPGFPYLCPNRSEGLLGDVALQSLAGPDRPPQAEQPRGASGQLDLPRAGVGDLPAVEPGLEQSEPSPGMVRPGVRGRSSPQVEIAVSGLRSGGEAG